jgi:hypothetical protein
MQGGSMAEQSNPTDMAIESLTIWLEADRRHAVAHVLEQVLADDSIRSRDRLIIGLLNVGAGFVLDLARQAEPDAHPVEAARRLLQQRALETPE